MIGQKTLKVMIIEDDKDDVLLITEMLQGARRASIRYEIAETLERGLDRLSDPDAHFDVVLLDLGLSDSLGLETLERFERQANQTPVVVLTGHSDEDVGLEAIHQGAQEYLPKKGLQGLALVRSLFHAVERKALEKELLDNVEKFQAVAEFTHDWEYWVDPEGRHIYVSPSCERISGYSPEEFINDKKLFPRIVHDEDRDSALLRLKDTHVKEGPPHSADFRLITKDGQVRWISHVCQSVYGQDGRWLGRRGSNRDITDRKKAEELLLREKEYTTAILHNSYDGIAVATEEGAFELFSPGMVRIFGYEAEEAVDVQHLMGKCILDPVEQKHFISQWEHDEECGLPGEYVVLATTKDKKRRWVRLQTSRMPDGKIVINGQDISEIKRMEKELQFINERLAEQNEVLKSLATTDQLTGIANRRALYTFAEQQWSRAVRKDEHFSVILVDIDHFKNINDTYGHLVGDRVLQIISEMLTNQKRPYDQIGRWGGEEFLLILPDADIAVAENVGERLRKSVSAHSLEVANDLHVSLTLSVGVASRKTSSEGNLDMLVQHADKALYHAKENGRNKTCTYTQEMLDVE